MNTEISKSLAEILDNTKGFPLSRTDLERLSENYGLDVNFYDDGKNAGIFYDGELLWFYVDRDKLYHYAGEMK